MKPEVLRFKKKLKIYSILVDNNEHEKQKA